jgi:two-component system KDP operon response regulator KdpE
LVLVVEDDPAVAEVLCTSLRGRGYRVEVAETGAGALDAASELEPDVVVLDLGLPDIDGIDVCRHLRRWTAMPIVVLSADGDELRKVTALDEGADDYVTKPFSMSELHARLRVALRHRDAAASTDAGSIEVGDLQIDPVAHTALVAGSPVRLTRKEFALLTLLARNCGRVLTHSTLLARVWDTTDQRRTDTLRVHVAGLRKKLGDGPGRPRLVSEPGVGYRMLLPEE